MVEIVEHSLIIHVLPEFPTIILLKGWSHVEILRMEVAFLFHSSDL